MTLCLFVVGFDFCLLLCGFGFTWLCVVFYYALLVALRMLDFFEFLL